MTDLEPDILECEVKWALENLTMSKASGGDGIPVELFQILEDAVKVLHSICQQIWKTQQWPQDWKKVSFHSNPKERQCQRRYKLLHNCTHLTCQQSNAQKSPSQPTVHKLRTSRCSSWIQKKQRNQRPNFKHPLDHRKKAREFQKNFYCFIDYAKAFDCVDHNKLENS